MLALDDIFNYWETLAELARDLDLPYQTVAKWSQRGRIPSDFWGPLIIAAAQRGKRLTYPQIAKANPTRQNGAQT